MSDELIALKNKLDEARTALAKAEADRSEALLVLTQTPQHAAYMVAQEALRAAEDALNVTEQTRKVAEATAVCIEAGNAIKQADASLREALIAHYKATKDKAPIPGASVRVKPTVTISTDPDTLLVWAKEKLPSAITVDTGIVQKAVLDGVIKSVPGWIVVSENVTAVISTK